MIRPIEGTCRATAVERVAVRRAEGVDGGEATSFRSVLTKMRGEEKELDRWLGRVMEQGLANPQELLRLQVVVHRFQHQVELASRVVEQVNQGIRTLTRPT
ncbi:MAG: hypothetical protein JXB32_22955 [Deltaproteobacteria bacterium]|nr:hypothetical protein [Deltaproteobacteria bacterium]